MMSACFKPIPPHWFCGHRITGIGSVAQFFHPQGRFAQTARFDARTACHPVHILQIKPRFVCAFRRKKRSAQKKRRANCPARACGKSLAEFAPAGAKKMKSVFPGDMCVGENTSRPNSVRVGRLRRTASARMRPQLFPSEKAKPFSTDWRRANCPAPLTRLPVGPPP